MNPEDVRARLAEELPAGMRLTEVEDMPVKYLNGRYMVRRGSPLLFHHAKPFVFVCFFPELDFARDPTSLLPSFGAASSLASGMTGPSGIIRCLTSRDITTFIWRCLLTRTEGEAAAREDRRERDLFRFISPTFCLTPARFV